MSTEITSRKFPEIYSNLCMPHFCGVQTLPLKMHHKGEKFGKIGKGMIGF